MDIKLLKVCKPSLQFALYLTTINGRSWVAKSVEFATHNSGTVSTKPSDPNLHSVSKTLSGKREKRSRSSSESSPSPPSPPTSGVGIIPSPSSLSFSSPILVKNPLPGLYAHPQFHTSSHQTPTLLPSFIHHRPTPPSVFGGVPSLLNPSPLQDEKIPSIPLCDCGCMDQIPLSFNEEKPNPSPNNLFTPEKQQRFQCMTCKGLESEVICIICAISCHGDHEVKYAGVSSNPCVCVQSRSLDPSHSHPICSSFSGRPSAFSSNLPTDELPAPKRQKLSNLDELGLVAQVCSQTKPLPVI